jgi:hypothetical protein
MHTNSGARGAKYEWIDSTNSIGKPSYIAIQIFRPFRGAIFSSNACESLDCPTFLRIPRTHVLFSLASLKSLITVQNLSTDGTITQLVTLPSLAMQIFKCLKSKQGHVGAAVKTLCQLLKKQRSGMDSATLELMEQDMNMGSRESSDTVGDDEYDEEEDESNADIFGLGEYPEWYM